MKPIVLFKSKRVISYLVLDFQQVWIGFNWSNSEAYFALDICFLPCVNLSTMILRGRK